MRMRPSGSPRTLERHRRRAIELFEQGFQPIEVASQLGVDRHSVSRWNAAYQKGRESGDPSAPGAR